jgi:hypothetical protein
MFEGVVSIEMGCQGNSNSYQEWVAALIEEGFAVLVLTIEGQVADMVGRVWLRRYTINDWNKGAYLVYGLPPDSQFASQGGDWHGERLAQKQRMLQRGRGK